VESAAAGIAPVVAPAVVGPAALPVWPRLGRLSAGEAAGPAGSGGRRVGGAVRVVRRLPGRAAGAAGAVAGAVKAPIGRPVADFSRVTDVIFRPPARAT